MKVLAVTLFALLVASTQAGKLTDNLAKVIPSFPTGYVINGTEADPHAAPYIVSLATNFDKHSHICGGTLVAKEWIITAAHCISNPVGMSVIAGLHKRAEVDERTQQRQVDFGRVHEQYTGGVGPFDIAILHVSEPFDFNEWVQPASLPSDGEINEGATHLYGWGQPKSYVFTAAKVLQTVETQIVPHEQCKEILPDTAPLAETNVCSDSLQQSISACNGDSGGPLVIERPATPAQLIGVVSWGYIPCGLANYPSVYTRVSAYIGWISKIQSAYYTLYYKMKVLAVTLFALLVASTQAGKLTDALVKVIPSFATGFVINGTDADPHSAPYIVSLAAKPESHSHSCGGTIISKEWILTAAHCISNPVGMSVIAGLHKRAEVDERTQQRVIDFGRVHEEFGGGVGPYDIAILHVSEPFEFNDWVKPAVLPSRNEIHEGETHLYGWGQPKAFQFSAASTLQTMTTDIVNYDACLEKMPENSKLAESNICSDSLQQSKSACNGDSGGPLVVEHKNADTELIGIVSWGFIPCGLANYPSVYTRVSAYIDWVAKVQSAYYILYYSSGSSNTAIGMKQFVALLVLAVASASANTIAWPGFPEGRIINGQEATSGEAPFIVSLQSTSGSHYCAGSLIQPDLVLTAAHCMTYTNFQVVAGAHSRTDKTTTQIRQASSSRQVIHEKYGGGVGPYDIGLVFLSEPFDLTARNRDGSSPVSTIQLPSKTFSANSDGVLFGWGRDNSGSLPDKLQKLDVNIIGYSDCAKALPSGNKLADTNVCTFTSGLTDGACNGDSGGPLVNRQSNGEYQQIGVVSWGYTPCASTKYPSVYTSVGSYSDWIEEHQNDF
ncbi:transmembrane protease serine 9-like [Drosophila albomicans]|uniref:Transmembrane protease serine 9-like n=1 Tax=Drosophila albomicans TaxID=7291 RepID=A0A6P8WBX2_DROAB|nr:transmembrane protease serine 9-like [Drosophila albomicans]